MGKKTKREIIDHDFADFKFTKKNLNSKLKTRGSVRLGMGKCYTTDEWEEKRKRVLKTPMH